MKKLICRIGMIVAAAITLTACGGGAKEITIGADELAGQLATETVTGDPLAAISDELLISTYFIDSAKIKDSAVYFSNGSNASEVAVIICNDSDYAAEVETLFKQRLTNQAELYASYNATEAAKLEKGIVRVSGNYVVLCATDDMEKAESILKDAGF